MARTYLVQRRRKIEVARKRLGGIRVLGLQQKVILWRRRRRRALSIKTGATADYEKERPQRNPRKSCAAPRWRITADAPRALVLSLLG